MDFGQSNAQIARAVPDVSSESLAAVTPRVYILAERVASQAQHIAASLGLTDSTPEAKCAEIPKMTLLQALQTIEKALDFAYGQLDYINAHING